MAEIRISHASPDEVIPISRRARKADRVEAWALAHKSVGELLQPVIERSNGLAFTGWANGEPVAMWGAMPATLLGDMGIVWMVTTDAVDRYQTVFLRQSAPLLAQLHARFPVLRNVVHIENEAAIRWLQWLGFRFGPEMRLGPDLAPFYPFERSVH